MSTLKFQTLWVSLLSIKNKNNKYIKPVGLEVFSTGIGSPTTTLTGFLKIKTIDNI